MAWKRPASVTIVWYLGSTKARPLSFRASWGLPQSQLWINYRPGRRASANDIGQRKNGRKQRRVGCLLVRLAADDNNSAGHLVHALEQEEGEQPVAEIVGSEGGVEPLACPRLLAKVLKAGVKNEGSNWRDVACRNTGLSSDLSETSRTCAVRRIHSLEQW